MKYVGKSEKYNNNLEQLRMLRGYKSIGQYLTMLTLSYVALKPNDNIDSTKLLVTFMSQPFFKRTTPKKWGNHHRNMVLGGNFLYQP